MGEKGPSTQEDVWSVPRETFEAFEQRAVDPPRTELIYQLVVVDGQLLSVARDGALNVPRRHDLFLGTRWAFNRLDGA
jgi:hypothetical protein